MSRDEIVGVIARHVEQSFERKGAPPPAVSSDSVVFGGGLDLDSLDLAALIVALETTTGVEPFESGVPLFRTVGELASLFSV